MDRRQFVSSTIAASAAALTAGASAATSTIDRLAEDDLFRGLADNIPHTTDEQYRNHIRELIAAKDWAMKRGIRFEWADSEWLDGDSGEPLRYLKAYLGTKLVGQSGERNSTICDDSTRSQYLRELAECEMSRCLCQDIRHSYDGGEVVCDLAGLASEDVAEYLDKSNEIYEDEAFEELYDVVHQYNATEEHHTARIYAMITAAHWAQYVEIEFSWEPISFRHEYEPDSPLCQCLAYRNGRLIGQSFGWDEEVMRNPREHRAVKLWAEFELALAIMGDFDNPRDDYIVTAQPQLNKAELLEEIRNG